MSVTTVYRGQLRCTSTCGDGGGTIVTDAATEYGGHGEYMSPTDVLGAALASCILTVVGITAARAKIDISGTTATVDKELTTERPLRLARVTVTVRVPHDLDAADRARLERSANTCPVGNSLHPDVDERIEFIYG